MVGVGLPKMEVRNDSTLPATRLRRTGTSFPNHGQNITDGHTDHNHNLVGLNQSENLHTITTRNTKCVLIYIYTNAKNNYKNKVIKLKRIT